MYGKQHEAAPVLITFHAHFQMPRSMQVRHTQQDLNNLQYNDLVGGCSGSMSLLSVFRCNLAKTYSIHIMYTVIW